MTVYSTFSFLEFVFEVKSPNSNDVSALQESFLKAHWLTTMVKIGPKPTTVQLNYFICHQGGRKEGNVLFNDALNTFYVRLYGVKHMVKDHSDSEKGNPLLPHRLLFPINSKGSFICTIPDRIAYTTAFVTPIVEHWLEREIAQWVHPMKDRSDDLSHNERTLLQRSYISLLIRVEV